MYVYVDVPDYKKRRNFEHWQILHTDMKLSAGLKIHDSNYADLRAFHVTLVHIDFTIFASHGRVIHGTTTMTSIKSTLCYAAVIIK